MQAQKRRTWIAAAIAGAVASAVTLGMASAAPGCPALPSRTTMPVEAVPKAVDIPEWRQRASQIAAGVASRDLSDVKLVFIGDSITQSWDPTLWNLFWSAYKPLNLGVSGDITRGVLWRLARDNWNPTLRPQVAVLLIGTNNVGWGSKPEDTALGVAEIIRLIQLRSPATRILLLGILPRGADASAPERALNAQVNALIRRCADESSVVYREPGSSMVGADGRISPQVMFDYLHLTMIGYGILGGSIDQQVRAMMSQPK